MWDTYAEVAAIVQVPQQEEIVQEQNLDAMSISKNVIMVTFAADADTNQVLQHQEVVVKLTLGITFI